MARSAVTHRNIERLVRRWATRLRLQDWRFEIQLCSDPEFVEFLKDEDEPDAAGAARQSVAATDIAHHGQPKDSGIQNREATIAIKRSAFTDNEADLEPTIVHELLHVMLLNVAPNANDGRAWDRFEQIINGLEEALTRGGEDV